ncbi:hypothetical protein HBN99_21595 [Pseudomonas oryzihabitans]|uniref:hypothetical protein n=1 Tax=Pseudomonas oryzihabitans TaxID=47885 RepID=UPI001473026F|nr:hypothetical protein [Pseudomonas oryzihabitans]NMZ66918.1 hypothetical protein [Pseudomonas oryzihabitans]
MRFLLSIVWTAMCLAFFMRLGFALQIMDPVNVFLDKDRCAVVKSYGSSSCKVRGRAEGNLDGTWTITLPEPPLTIQMPEGPMAYQNPHWRLQGGNLTGVGLFAGLVISSLAGNYLITRRRPDHQADGSPA